MTDQIPSLGGTTIGPQLSRYAASIGNGRAAVEVGSWLGAGTIHIAQGIVASGVHAPLHVYDRFRTTKAEVPKAAKFGVTLHPGQNTQPFVEKLIHPYGIDTHFHRGSILLANWKGGPIGLYVDDAAKTKDLFLHIIHTFGPSWIPDETILFLMDFEYWRTRTEPAEIAKYKYQKLFVDNYADSFERIETEETLDGTTAIFRYRNPLPFRDLEKSAIGLKTRLRKIRRLVFKSFG